MSKLQGQCVVITGASSGLGREAAFQFAARGANLVLAARRTEALEDVARRCRELGGQALWLATEITRETDVLELADAAVAAFGQLDVWVNNAGVTLFSLLEDAPFADHRRVIEVNLFGAMLGARAALPIFRRQGRGVLINVGSVLSKVGQPYVPSYVISKFGVHGLSEVLRTELAEEPGVHVCTLYPYVVDTQHFESGANEIGRPARGLPPAQSPERVARAIVALAERPRRELHVPRIAALALVLHRLAPRTVELLVSRALRRFHFGDETEAPTTGNLYTPDPRPPSVHGSRPPRVGVPGFAAWAARELFRIELQSVARGVAGLRGRFRRAAAAASS